MKIQSLDELKELAQREEGVEVSVLLAGGLCKSRKRIDYSADGWWVDNYIDGSTQELKTDKQLAEQTYLLTEFLVILIIIPGINIYITIQFNTPFDVTKLKEYSAYYYQGNLSIEKQYIEID